MPNLKLLVLGSLGPLIVVSACTADSPAEVGNGGGRSGAGGSKGLAGGAGGSKGLVGGAGGSSGLVGGSGGSSGLAGGSGGNGVPNGGGPTEAGGTANAYADNLARILSGPARNTNHDGSPYLTTPSAKLVLEEHYGPRSEYLNNPADNPEGPFPVATGGQNRAGCEFSHFSYDDPLVYQGKPGASHLNIFFGNTHVNAFSTYETLSDSGGSTCNGQELNRTGYWAPALFDDQGNVRIPERVVIYYKGEGLANGRAKVYPPRSAMISAQNINTISESVGGSESSFSFKCSNNWSGTETVVSDLMPDCVGTAKNGGDPTRTVLEVNVKFPQCLKAGSDPAQSNSWYIPRAGSWYGSNCEPGDDTFTNLEYFMNYVVEGGETTKSWYLASDVNPATYQIGQRGQTLRASWWGGWHKDINALWIKNCVNNNTYSDCGFGFLSSGADGVNMDGPALKYRPQYQGPNKVAASQIFAKLCPQAGKAGRAYAKPEDAAYCTPGEYGK